MSIALNDKELEMVNGGAIAKNPEGTCDTDDKYLIVDDNTKQVIAKTGGYAHARMIAEALNLSTDTISIDEVQAHPVK